MECTPAAALPVLDDSVMISELGVKIWFPEVSVRVFLFQDISSAVRKQEILFLLILKPRPLRIPSWPVSSSYQPHYFI